MTTIDEVEDLRAELRHCHLTVTERRGAEARLAELLRTRNVGPSDNEQQRQVGSYQACSRE